MERPFAIPDWARRGALRWCWLGGRGLAYAKRGGARFETYTWLEDWFDHSFDSGTVARLREVGFNLVTIPFYSGFGLRVEAPWMAAAAAVVDRLHRHGLRVLAAIDTGGLCPETMAGEVAEWAEWVHRTADGRPMWAEPDSYWRWVPDVTHPGYRDYLCGVIDQAVGAGCDGIWLHELAPRCGHGADAVADWREFIDLYTDFYRRKCGYLDQAYLDPPPLEVPGDPLWLDWMDFWQRRFVTSLSILNGHLKTADPQRLTVASGPFQEHHLWERYRVHVDAVHVANRWRPAVEHGDVVSQAAIFLIADAAGLVAFGDGLSRDAGGQTDLPTGPEIELMLAEGMFFGGQSVSAAWAGLPEGNAAAAPLDEPYGAVQPWHCAFERHDRFEALKQFCDFAREVEALHQPKESAATIAILHSRDSLRFEREATVLNLRAAQLACLRRHLPADILVSDDLAELDRYDVLIVPEQPCLSQTALSRISAWVRAGGGLILVGEAGVRARRGRLRPPNWLASALGVGGSRWSLPNAEVVAAGNGRVLALPALGVEPFAYPSDAPDPSAGWDWLVDAVHDVSAWPVPVIVEGPDTLFCRAYWLSGGNLAVMLLNYQRGTPAEELLLVLNLDWPAGVPEAVMHFPGAAPGGVELRPTRFDTAVEIRVPRVDVYAVIEVRAQSLKQRRAAALAEPLPETEPAGGEPAV